MIEKITNGWKITKESLKVIKEDKEIIAFPIISSILIILLSISFFLLIIGAITAMPLIGESPIGIIFYITFLLFIFISYSIAIFFKSAIITSATIRFNGKNPSFSEGIKEPLKRIHKLILWAIILGIINIILTAIRNIGKQKSKNIQTATNIGTSTIGTAWNLLSFFVIPIILFEDKSVFQSLKRSKELFIKSWGENITAQISTGAIFTILILISAIPLIFSVLIGNKSITIITLLIFLLCLGIILIISTSANGILTAALYHYATKNKMPQIYNKEFTKQITR